MKRRFAKVCVEELECPSQSFTKNTFGINWNTDCITGLLTHHQNLPEARLDEWAQNLRAALKKNLIESLPEDRSLL